MQQTVLDHWLKRNLVTIYRVYCNVLPTDMPPEVQIEEAPPGSAGQRYRITPRNEKEMGQVVAQFKLQSITYSTREDERTGFMARMVNRPRRSFTYDSLWRMIFLFSGISTALLAWQYLPAGQILDSAMGLIADLKSDFLK